MRRFKMRIIVFAVLVLAAFLLLAYGASSKLQTVTYSIESPKLAQNIRFALVTDLHSCKYGEGARELLAALDAQNPDAVLLGGDIFDDVLPHGNAKAFLTSIAARYPCYYVSGNHEYWSGQIEELKAWLKSSGITVLAGGCEELHIREQAVNICGVDDPTLIGTEAVADQIAQAYAAADPSNYTILLSHRPELVSLYKTYAFDLVAAGHAHGGQWRIPGIVNGVFAPDQGWLPEYAGGRYALNERTTMLVSRGLARETTRIPRIFNRPELVIINIS